MLSYKPQKHHQAHRTSQKLHSAGCKVGVQKDSFCLLTLVRREIGSELRCGWQRPANSPPWAEACLPTCSSAPREAIYPLPNTRQPGLPQISGKRYYTLVARLMLSTAPRASRSTKLLARVETHKSCTAPLFLQFQWQLLKFSNSGRS